MNEILINAMTILVLLAGLATLFSWARRDTFSGPGVGHRSTNALAHGAAYPDCAQRTVDRAAVDIRLRTYGSHATTANS